jgi:hypothetical protein
LEKKSDEIASVCKVDTDPEKIEEYIPEGEGLQQDLTFDEANEAQLSQENAGDELNENGESQSYDQEGTLPFDDIEK